jgi:HK97 family phage prohead protease
MKTMKSTPIELWRRSAKSGASPDGAVIAKGFEVGISEGAGERCITFTISTGTVDRMGDTVAASGWDLTAYEKNPVVLWGHDYDHLPLGKGVDLKVEGSRLKATVQFIPFEWGDIGKKAQHVHDMLKGGYLNAVSVGFRPLEYEFSEDPERNFGVDFTKQELLEFSVVTVPANPEALTEPPEAAPKSQGGKKMTTAAKPTKKGGRPAVKKDGEEGGDELNATLTALKDELADIKDRLSALEGSDDTVEEDGDDDDTEDKDGDDAETEDKDGDDDGDPEEEKSARRSKRRGVDGDKLLKEIRGLQRAHG